MAFAALRVPPYPRIFSGVFFAKAYLFDLCCLLVSREAVFGADFALISRWRRGGVAGSGGGVKVSSRDASRSRWRAALGSPGKGEKAPGSPARHGPDRRRRLRRPGRGSGSGQGWKRAVGQDFMAGGEELGFGGQEAVLASATGWRPSGGRP